MKTRTSHTKGTLAAVVLAATTGMVAVASSGGPTTERVVASVGLTRVSEPTVRTCTGSDGTYSEVRDVFEGTVTSTDPRLTGALRVEIDALINTTTGLGTIHGRFTIRDPATGNLKINGPFNGVVVDFVKYKGLVDAAIAVGSGGGRLVANLSVVVTGDTAIGNIGSPLTGVESDPAVIQVGSCSGGFGS